MNLTLVSTRIPGDRGDSHQAERDAISQPQTPSMNELRITIQVLQILGNRIKMHASHSATLLPDSPLGRQYAARTELLALQQTHQIDIIAAQLANWCSEMA